MPHLYTTGVYKIVNKMNGKLYVGSSSESLKQREWKHKSALRKGKHVNKYLQNAWLKHGENNFSFEIIERCAEELCVKREQFWLDFYRSYEPEIGYNRSKTAGSMLGFRHSDETKRKVSETSKGRTHNRGRVHSEESRKTMAKGQKLRFLRPDEILKQVEIANRPEVRSKKSEASKKQWQNESHRKLVSDKNREAAKAQWADPERRSRHREAMAKWRAERQKLKTKTPPLPMSLPPRRYL